MEKNWTDEPILNFRVFSKHIQHLLHKSDEISKKELYKATGDDNDFIDKFSHEKLWERSIFWYQKAALQNEPFAVEFLRRAELFKSTKQKAENGDKDAQYLMALYYFHEYGIYSDFSEGEQWMRKAVLNGSEEALQSLEEWYQAGGDWYDISELEAIELGLEEDYTFLPPVVFPEDLDLSPYFMRFRHGQMYWRFAADNHTDLLWHAFSVLDFGETLKAAEEGNAEKQYQLAWLYNWGLMVNQDMKKAVEWFVRSAYNGYAPAQAELGMLYQYRICSVTFLEYDYTINDYEKRYGEMIMRILKNWKEEPVLYFELAEIGSYVQEVNQEDNTPCGSNVYSEYVLFDIDLRGYSGNAVYWYTKAAAHKERLALRLLKNMEDFKTIERKAIAGDADAQYRLSHYYQDSYGSPRDLGESEKWLQKAADNGSAIAKEAIEACVGMDCIQPCIYPDDYDYEYECSFLGLRHGKLKKNEMEQAKVDKIWELFSGLDFEETKIAAEEGNAEKQYQLAWLYDWGQGTKQDLKKAIEWFVKSAHNGYAPAQTELGIMYQYGIMARKSSFEIFKNDADLADKGNE